jgi:hypothetical protein
MNMISFFVSFFFLKKRNSIDTDYEHRTWMRSKVPQDTDDKALYTGHSEK